MNRIVLLILVAVLASACASPTRAVWFDAALEAETMTAIDAWNAKLDVACPGVRLALAADRSSADIIVDVGRPTTKGKVGEELGGDIVIDPTFTRDYPGTVPAVIAHELGHALGAHHTNVKSDLMYGSNLPYDRSPEPTVADVSQVCNAWDGAP